MTVATSTSKSGPYAGAGTTGPFTVDFRFLENSHLQVVKAAGSIETVLVLNSDYTVAGAGAAAGTVTLAAALASGETLTIVRNVPATQEADYVQNDAFPAESHERALDKLTMLVQQIAETIARTLRLPISVSGVSPVLPVPAANQVLAWNGSASGLQNMNPSALATIVAFGTANADIFTGDGLQTVFTLTANPGAQANLDVSVGGVTQLPGVDYSWFGGTSVSFAAAPPIGAKILLRYFQGLPQGVTDSGASTFISNFDNTVATTVSSKLRESVSVLDFMTAAERLAVQTNTWTGAVTNVSDALDRASAACTSLLIPAGVYRLIRPWILKTPKMCLYGAGAGVTEFQPAAEFAGSLWGGQDRSALIWYQPPGTWSVNAQWIVGGEISNMTINCGGVCDGIVFNRVCQSQIVRNVHIYLPFNGIDSYLGWCHTYANVYVQGAAIKSINIGPGSNGTAMMGCFLRGFSPASHTQIHLDIDSASVGNSFSGGAIECCDNGVRVTGRGQISINGTDFEENFYRFGQAFGTYSGATLVEVGGSSILTGCTFIGVPSGGGVVEDGASFKVESCTFQNNGPVPTGPDEYALWGKTAGQSRNGLPGAGISESNCTFYGWGDTATGRVRRGFINSVFLGAICAEDVVVPQAVWTPVLAGFVTTGAVTIQDAVCVKQGHLFTFSFQVRATTIGTSGASVTGLLFAPSIASAVSVITGSTTNPSAALVYPTGSPTGSILLPDKAAWGNSLIVSGSCFTNS